MNIFDEFVSRCVQDCIGGEANDCATCGRLVPPNTVLCSECQADALCKLREAHRLLEVEHAHELVRQWARESEYTGGALLRVIRFKCVQHGGYLATMLPDQIQNLIRGL